MDTSPRKTYAGSSTLCTSVGGEAKQAEPHTRNLDPRIPREFGELWNRRKTFEHLFHGDGAARTLRFNVPPKSVSLRELAVPSNGDLGPSLRDQ